MTTTSSLLSRELRAASDAEITDATSHADPMVLRGLLYQLTGDAQILDMPVTRAVRGAAQVTMFDDPEDVALLRGKAADYLRSLRDGAATSVEIGMEERLVESVSLVAGYQIAEEHTAFALEQLALDRWNRSLKWQKEPSAEQLANFSVTIIGAGMGGLNAALQLKRAGIPYVLVEKNAGVGGTWYENRYPGARLDTPSRAYTHVFGIDFDVKSPFWSQRENEEYLGWVADTFELRDDILFETEVHSLTWDDAAAMWDIRIEGSDGVRTLRSNAVITCVGFLNRPSIPEIEGAEAFTGPSWHTARWPVGADLRGKRVAVIGTGATGYQLVPELALECEHVTVFQRTPQWVSPAPGYRSGFPEQVCWLDRNFPFYRHFMRLRSCMSGGFTGVGEIDPQFHDPHAVSADNGAVREFCLGMLAAKVADPDLVAKMTPEHPPWSARMVVVDFDYSILEAIQRDDVSLVTSGIRRINRDGIETADGCQHDVDVIVYATGFRANDFLFPMTVKGRDGLTIKDFWAADGARAYLGCMIPGFPNLWSIYGPNTNGSLSPASIHELGTRYALQCMERLITEGGRSIEVKEDAFDRYNKYLDERNALMVWSDPRSQNYYWTQHGRSAVMNPFRSAEMWEYLRYPDFAELEIG